MIKFAFISRHEPTKSQHELAAKEGIDLVYVGDRDAFTVDVDEELSPATYFGVVVVHPAAALRLASRFMTVGVFENANRAPVGEKPRFEAKALHLYSLHREIGA